MKYYFKHLRNLVLILLCVIATTGYAQQAKLSLEDLFTSTTLTKNLSTDMKAYYNNLLYTQLIHRNDAAQYQRYITTFKNNAYTPDVTQHLHTVLYTYSQNYDAIRSLKKYALLYPSSVEALQALQQYDALVFDSYKLNYSIPSLKKFVTENPNNTLLPIAYDKLYTMYVTGWQTYNGSLKYVYELPNATNAPTAWNDLFTSYAYNYNADSITVFKQKHKAYKGTISLAEAIALAQLVLLPMQDAITKLWGYKNSTLNEWIITPQYISAESFAEGFAVIETTNGSNYINKKNEKMLRDDVQEANVFSHGMAVITSNGKDGAINRLFTIEIPCTYLYLDNYNGIYLKAQNQEGLYGTITNGEEWIIPATHTSLESLNKEIN
ncbi:MAG: WG repeat-containing protein [Bacteroidia bacterium]|nr:WG repeat-containing protein [Bacteroidia bacterium]